MKVFPPMAVAQMSPRNSQYFGSANMASHAAHNPRTPEMSRAVLLLRLSIESTSESEAALIAQPISDDMKKEDIFGESEACRTTSVEGEFTVGLGATLGKGGSKHFRQCRRSFQVAFNLHGSERKASTSFLGVQPGSGGEVGTNLSGLRQVKRVLPFGVMSSIQSVSQPASRRATSSKWGGVSRPMRSPARCGSCPVAGRL